MAIIHERATRMDVSGHDMKVAVRHPGKRKGSFTTDVRTFWTTISQILKLIDYLKAERVTKVVLEAGRNYSQPVYYLMKYLPGVAWTIPRQSRSSGSSRRYPGCERRSPNPRGRGWICRPWIRIVPG
ncbi:hypothetical protein GCM10023166_33910 [Paeniglutamicibacter cryotolerans]|uniref:Uncharacterized protein n=1 Tax=Paeniglutamicibacter cryotolerans TaxID=670079 RepID=A0A839QQW9_9MICC|nr:hypothetical protein [Paeniglutamicibacter cryotolerans]